jgi:hypothetical protein
MFFRMEVCRILRKIPTAGSVLFGFVALSMLVVCVLAVQSRTVLSLREKP